MADVSARKRSNGKWEYRIELAPIDGKRQQKSKGGFRTKTEALKAGRDALNEYENYGRLTDKSNMSYADLLDKWIEEYSTTDLKSITTAGYVKKIRLYIKPSLGQYKVQSLSREVIQKTINDLSNKGLSKNTVSSIRGIITKSLEWAEMNNIILHSPAYRIKLPKNTTVPQTSSPHVYIPKEMFEKIINRFPVGHPSYLPLILGYHCGLRLGETFGLLWSDIDLENKVLYVNRQVQWHQNRERSKEDIKASNGTSESNGGYWYFSHPKFNSYRCIDLDDELIEILKAEYNKQNKAKEYYEDLYYRYYTQYPVSKLELVENKIGMDKTKDEIEFVCRREHGEYITPRTMQHTSRIIHKSLEFPEFDYHSLRHTHATMLRENGCPNVYIQRRLGHVKLQTTLDIYANHLTDRDKQNGLNILNNIMSAKE